MPRQTKPAVEQGRRIVGWRVTDSGGVKVDVEIVEKVGKKIITRTVPMYVDPEAAGEAVENGYQLGRYEAAIGELARAQAATRAEIDSGVKQWFALVERRRLDAGRKAGRP